MVDSTHSCVCAGVACCVALFHEGRRTEATWNTLVRYIEQAFSLLSEALECSSASQHATETLRMLYDQARTLESRSAPARDSTDAEPVPATSIDWNALLLPELLHPQDVDGIQGTIVEFASNT